MIAIQFSRKFKIKSSFFSCDHNISVIRFVLEKRVTSSSTQSCTLVYIHSALPDDSSAASKWVWKYYFNLLQVNCLTFAKGVITWFCTLLLFHELFNLTYCCYKEKHVCQQCCINNFTKKTKTATVSEYCAFSLMQIKSTELCNLINVLINSKWI